MKQDSINLHN